MGLGSRAHIGTMELIDINWLPIDLRVEQLELNHMFIIVNNQAPA